MNIRFLALAGVMAAAMVTAVPRARGSDLPALALLPRMVPIVGPLLSQVVAQMIDIEDVGSRPVTVFTGQTQFDSEDVGSRPTTVYVGQTQFATEDIGSRPMTVYTGQTSFAIEEVGSRLVTVLYDPFANTDVGSRPITIDGTCQVTVSIVFSGLSDPIASAPTSVPYEWWRNEPGTPVELSGTAPVVNGQVSLLVPTRRPLLFTVQTGTWLRKAIAINTGGPTASATMVLINGDINQDNEIGAADFSELAAAYDAVEGDPNYNPNADLNKDGEVGAADFSILAANYDAVGD